MTYRFPLFVLFLAISLGMVVYGAFFNQTRLWQVPAPEDDQVNLPEETSFLVGEIQLTDWISKERIHPDAYGHLLDTEQEAECFS
jgi:hypothetical protein